MFLAVSCTNNNLRLQTKILNEGNMITKEEYLKINTLLRSSICHEWGHCLQYLLLGYIQFVSELEVIDSLFRVDGHLKTIELNIVAEKPDMSCMSLRYMHLSEEENISIYVAGAVAEKICGYSEGVVKGTDKNYINDISKDKKYINKIYKGVETTLTAYKGVLEDLTEITIKEYTEVYTEDGKRKAYVNIPKDYIYSLLEETLAKHGFDKELMSIEGPNISYH